LRLDPWQTSEVKGLRIPLLVVLLASGCSGPVQTTSPHSGTGTPSASRMSPAHHGVAIWTADAATDGIKPWHGLQSPPGRLRVVEDPKGLYGKVYLAFLRDGDVWSGDGTARAEFYGTDLPSDSYLEYVDGDDYYFGWRSMISRGKYSTGDGNLGNLVQFKGDSNCGGPAVGLTLENGRVTFRSELSGIFWRGPSAARFAGSWHSFVVHIHFSTNPSAGFVELWFDGVRQTLTDGTRHHVMATMCPSDRHVYLKMGFYRGAKITGYGAAYHWIDTPRLGTSYSAVVPRSPVP
jgi:Polysaccharide lyase